MPAKGHHSRAYGLRTRACDEWRPWSGEFHLSPAPPSWDLIGALASSTRRAERARDGVPVFPEVIEQLDKLAAELKIKPLRERK